MIKDSSLFQLVRSALFVPGDKPRALEKAPHLGADALIIDLEDAVAPDQKAHARIQAGSAVARFKSENQYTVLRIAQPGSQDLALDIPVAAKARPDAVLIAKLETPEQLIAICKRLESEGFDGAVWAMIETPRAIMEVDDIVRQGRHHRLNALVAGTNDLAAELRLPESGNQRATLEPHLARLVLATRAFGLIALDGVFNAYTDQTGLMKEAARGRAMGFDGKTLIHPDQIRPTHHAYAPTVSETVWAEKVIAAFNDPANTGKGAVPVDGRMVEAMHLHSAKHVLAAQVKEKG